MQDECRIEYQMIQERKGKPEMMNTGFLKTTIKGGLIFLIPIGFLILVLGKAVEVVLKVSRPIVQKLAIEGIAGVVLVEVLAVLLLVVFCFLAGLAASRPAFKKKGRALEELLLSNIPAYSFVDGMMRSVAAAEEQASNLIPVLAHFDDNAQLGFEIERSEAGNVAVFLPGCPNPWSGSTIFMSENRVEPLDIKTHEAIKLLRVLGRGSSQYSDRRAEHRRDYESSV